MSSDAPTTGGPGSNAGEPGGGAPPALGTNTSSISGTANTVDMLLQAARRERRTPKAIGPYRVVQWLASGGMGEVYLCEDDRLGKKVVVKVAHADLAPHIELMNQIREEGRRLAGVKRNMHVARVLAAGDEVIDGVSVPYIAMEYEDGEPFGGPISNAWTIQKKVEVFGNVCKAVEALHEQHLVHADIKPSNIVLVGDEPRLIDFGIARVVRKLGGESGQLCAGTPGYFDPAVGGTTGRKPDQRTDIYCLGLTLASFLAGKEPTADEPSGWPSRGIPPSQECAGIDRELDGIILRAIERDPGKRYQSVAALREALEGWVAYRRTLPSRIGQSARRVRRTGAMVLERSRVAGMVMVALIAALVAYAAVWPLFYFTSIGGVTQGLALAFVRPPQGLTRVRVIDGSDYAKFEEACARHGVVIPNTPSGRRVAWAALARKLASAGGKPSVGFDLFFVAPDETNDPILKAALLELAAACKSGTVALAMDYWDNKLTPTLADPDRVKVGCADYFPPAESHGPFLQLTCRREGQVFADGSFALALACAHGPRRGEPQIETNKWLSRARIRFLSRGGAGWLGQQDDDLLDLPNVMLQDGFPGNDSNRFKPGDLLTLLPIIPPPRDVLDRATLTAAEVLDMRPGDLQSWLVDRVVIVGGREDEIAWNGRSIRPTYLHAIAVEELLAEQYVSVPGLAQGFLLTLAGTALGTLIGVGAWVSTRASRTPAAVAATAIGCLVAILACGAGCVWLGASTRYFLNPMIVCLGAALAVCGMVVFGRATRSLRDHVDFQSGLS